MPRLSSISDPFAHAEMEIKFKLDMEKAPKPPLQLRLPKDSNESVIGHGIMAGNIAC